ncbi:MAG TPA: aminotransferase class V-fold PLP-dependent enzyme [Acetobacteraceae bacterium]|nr:aminotransferase class V-fold PLP-dependent enzyme [Acetobacteraceae bacterium]
MLPSQRASFDIPQHVCYMNAAAVAPLPRAVKAAGEVGVARKAQPWAIEPGNAQRQFERARAAAARLINADPDDVALISSVSYGIATAGKVLSISRGSRVLLLQDDHSSPVLEWLGRAEAQGFSVEVVARPDDGDWTAALLAAIERQGALPVGMASISSVHWADGGAVDVARVAAALKPQNARFVIDATHGAGVMNIDVRALDPDFLVFPTYKWVLGPYGRAFLYVAKRWQNGAPIEQAGSQRRSFSSERAPYMRDTSYVTNARRYDMGERDHYISLEMASIGMEMVAGWGQQAIVERLRMLTDRLAEGLCNTGVLVSDQRVRAPHILSLRFPGGMPDNLIERLEAENVFVSPRLGLIRISPHAYNDEADVDRFVAVFRRVAS